jgi:hypothetical protein
LCVFVRFICKKNIQNGFETIGIPDLLSGTIGVVNEESSLEIWSNSKRFRAGVLRNPDIVVIGCSNRNK